MKIKNLEHFANLAPADILSWIKSNSSRATSVQLEIAKALVALDSKREGKGTLKKFVRAETGEEIPDHAFSCARVFSELIGTGPGTITEPDYDAVALRWHLQASAILGLLEKASLADGEKSTVRENLAEILRTRPADGYAQLENLKKSLKPAPRSRHARSSEETTDDETPEAFDPIRAIRQLGHYIAESDDVAEVMRLQAAIATLTHVVELKAKEMTTPASLAA